MQSQWNKVFICLLTLSVGLSCASHTQDSIVEHLQRIDYVRTGGLVWTNDHLQVSPSGAIQVQGGMLGKKAGQLTPAQIQELVTLFHGWDRTKSEHVRTGIMDAFEYEIEYGQRRIRVIEFENVPQNFTRVRERLESIAATLPNAK